MLANSHEKLERRSEFNSPHTQTKWSCHLLSLVADADIKNIVQETFISDVYSISSNPKQSDSSGEVLAL